MATAPATRRNAAASGKLAAGGPVRGAARLDTIPCLSFHYHLRARAPARWYEAPGPLRYTSNLGNATSPADVCMYVLASVLVAESPTGRACFRRCLDSDERGKRTRNGAGVGTHQELVRLDLPPDHVGAPSGGPVRLSCRSRPRACQGFGVPQGNGIQRAHAPQRTCLDT